LLTASQGNLKFRRYGMSSHEAAILEADVPAIEKPQNGVAGLKHWRYDLMAGCKSP
jgi:hypothetical protein